GRRHRSGAAVRRGCEQRRGVCARYQGSAQDSRLRAQRARGSQPMNPLPSASESEMLLANLLSDAYPDERGRYGPFGGRYVPETLVPALDRLQAGVDRYLRDEEFLAELHAEL